MEQLVTALTDLTTLGLLLDFVGALFLFIFGVPKRPFWDRNDIVVVTDHSRSETTEILFSKLYAVGEYCGIACLSIGFLLQLIPRYV